MGGSVGPSPTTAVSCCCYHPHGLPPVHHACSTLLRGPRWVTDRQCATLGLGPRARRRRCWLAVRAPFGYDPQPTSAAAARPPLETDPNSPPLPAPAWFGCGGDVIIEVISRLFASHPARAQRGLVGRQKAWRCSSSPPDRKCSATGRRRDSQWMMRGRDRRPKSERAVAASERGRGRVRCLIDPACASVEGLNRRGPWRPPLRLLETACQGRFGPIGTQAGSDGAWFGRAPSARRKQSGAWCTVDREGGSIGVRGL